MSSLSLTSYAVLGLVEQCQPCTPYDLKAAVTGGIENFWSLPHTQLYTEPPKLAVAGYLSEQREEHGRRRKVYALTAQGRKALADWRAHPTPGFTEMRDPGLLQLFFGADVGPLAAVQLAAHERQLASYQAIARELGDDVPEPMRLVLESGMGHEREWVRFWRRLAQD